MQIFALSFYLPFASRLPAQVLRESVRNRVRVYLGQYGDELHGTIRREARIQSSARARPRTRPHRSDAASERTGAPSSSTSRLLKTDRHPRFISISSGSTPRA